MMTLLELAKEIQKNPEDLRHLLNSFRTTDADLRLFLLSLKELPASMAPELIRTFYREQEKTTYKTFMDVIKNDPAGTIFEVVDSGISYSWSGFNKDSEPTVIQLGKVEQTSLDPATKIHRKF
jgi:hypothetical protein